MSIPTGELSPDVFYRGVVVFNISYKSGVKEPVNESVTASVVTSNPDYDLSELIEAMQDAIIRTTGGYDSSVWAGEDVGLGYFGEQELTEISEEEYEPVKDELDKIIIDEPNPPPPTEEELLKALEEEEKKTEENETL